MVMGKKIFTLALRQIQSSLGRYLAIFAIIALGVGFFSGLKISRTAMVTVADEYLEHTAFFDYRLVSTLGFEEGDAKAFGALDFVEAAQSGIYQDALIQTPSETVPMRLYSLTEGINLPILSAGRLPESTMEFVGDERYFRKSDLGGVFTLSPENDSELFDDFAGKQFTLVGIGTSPLYMNFERGTTSVGSGSLAAFMLLPREAFTQEIDTEIYLRLQSREDIYSDAYKALIESHKEEIESVLTGRGEIRLESVKRDAQEELNEGWQTYHWQYHEYTEAKETTLMELRQAELQLSAARQEIEDNRKTLTSSRNRLLSGKRDIQKALLAIEEGRVTLAEKEEETLAQIAEQEAALLAQKAQVDEALAIYRDLTAKKQEAQAALSALQSSKDQLQGGILQLQATSLAQIEALKEQRSEAEALGDSAAAAALSAQIEAIRTQTDEEIAVLQGQIAQVDAGIAQAQSGIGQLDAALSQFNYPALSMAEKQLQEGLAQIAQGKALALSEMEAARRELDEGETLALTQKAEVDSLLGQVEKGFATLQEGEDDLASAQMDYEEGYLEAMEAFRDAEWEFAKARQDLEEGQQDIDELSAPDLYVLDRETNAGYASFGNDSSIVESISTVFPLFFFLVAALVCSTTMTRMIGDERTEIGVMLGMGYSRAAVFCKYLIYSGSAALLGGVGGFLLLSYVIPKIIWMAYSIMYGFSAIRFIFRWDLFLGSLAAALACSAGVTLSVYLRETRSFPAQLMRPKTPKSGRRILLEKVPALWNRLPFMEKISLRNVFRYKGRMGMMILGIGGCTALLLTGFGISDSIQNVVNYQYEEISLYDYELLFSEELTAPQQQQFLDETGLSASDVEFYQQEAVDVYGPAGMKSASLCATFADNFSSFMDLHTGENTVPYPQKGEAVVSRGLSEWLDIQIGDSLRLMDEDHREMTVMVSGIFDNFVNHYVYVDPRTWQSAIGEELAPNAAHAYAPRNHDPQTYVPRLIDWEYSANVSVTQSFREQIMQMMSSLSYVVILIIICAGALAFIVLYNLNHINITERIREIATIKVLGFYPMESASYVFRENLLLTLLGALAGLGLGVALHRFVMAQVQIDMMYFQARILPISYLYSILLTFVFTMLVNFAMYFRIQQVPMAESLKSVE